MPCAPPTHQAPGTGAQIPALALGLIGSVRHACARPLIQSIPLCCSASLVSKLFTWTQALRIRHPSDRTWLIDRLLSSRPRTLFQSTGPACFSWQPPVHGRPRCSRVPTRLATPWPDTCHSPASTCAPSQHRSGVRQTLSVYGVEITHQLNMGHH